MTEYTWRLKTRPHNGPKVELGVGRGVTNGAKNGTTYILSFHSYFITYGHVKTLTGRYLPKESFCLTISLKKYILK
jgi:hypothetical protein